ncbi:putative phage integrase [Burkholderia pseudomallei]|nr:putative phage integrase [Burkholderia pseudomallei]
MTHCYATAMLMAGMTPAFCAKQLGHSVEMFLTTYSKWIDGIRTIWRWRWKRLFLPRTSSDEGKININR